jgi:hypothetical protein
LGTKYSSVVARGSEPTLREIWSLIFDLVLAHRGPYMARLAVLVLTEEGRAVRAEAVNRMAEPPASLTTLSAADRRALRDILGRLTAEKIKAGGGPAGSRSRPVENAARRS